MVSVLLPNGEERSVPAGTGREIVASLGRRWEKEVVGLQAEAETRDLRLPVPDETRLRALTAQEPEGLEVLRHTAAHMLAQAVKRLYPEARLGTGPATRTGFYYDIDLPHPIGPEDLERIQAAMQQIAAEDLPVIREELSREEAIRLFASRGESYKTEIIAGIPEGTTISVYSQGEFTDLCAGPHVERTGLVKAIRLQNISGSYWRGDAGNPMLVRIYGTAFAKTAELEAYLHALEEAKKRDHRRLGRDLDLFSVKEEGPGFPFLHPKGMAVRNVLEELWRREHRRRGYVEVKTPVMLTETLWQRSGHYDHYKENMYFSRIEEQGFAIKPMNCPGGMLIYKDGVHSYRDLPLRVGELGLVHRHELSGTLHGLMRARSFTQDDAHLFMAPEQIKEEVIGVLELVDHFYRDIFGFSYRVELSTRPENSMGDPEVWERAESALKEALTERGLPFQINPGDGAFYGPKIDFHLEDSLGRTWQCGTVQLDFLLPERFDLHYIGSDGQRHRPVVVHRVVYGSIERFLAILVEHYAGAFPVWLAPVQVRILPIAQRHQEAAAALYRDLRNRGFRVERDDSDEKIGARIRSAQLQKIPYMLVIGDREMEEGAVAVRERQAGDLGRMPVADFVERLDREAAIDGVGRLW